MLVFIKTLEKKVNIVSGKIFYCCLTNKEKSAKLMLVYKILFLKLKGKLVEAV
jgi:hypothetical protein